MNLTAFLVLYVCAGLIALIAWGTLTRNRLGVNLGKVPCPRCLRAIPEASLSQRIFGGARCPACKTLVNKWGREIMPSRKDKPQAAKSKS